DEIPVVDAAVFRKAVLDDLSEGAHLAAMFGFPQGEVVRLVAVTADHGAGCLSVFSTNVADAYPALTPDNAQAHWFEREIAEQWGILPAGHPWLKPIRFHRSYRHGRDAWHRSDTDEILPCVTEFFRVEGIEVHEVAVGPVHAGVIEPGHFRFQCHGEEVFHLEISLGYQHRGVERKLVGGPDKRTVPYMETLAGDTSIGHMTAYCQAIEALAGATPSARAQVRRTIALELERLANHVGDLGALANDVGYLPTAQYCGRLRGDFLNGTAFWCGNRFGRGLVRPGGVGFDLEAERAKTLAERLVPALRDTHGATDLLWNAATVLARFVGCGTVPQRAALDLGLVGPAARACGIDRDVRQDFPTGFWRFAQIPMSVWPTGDVFARAYVRSLEVQRSGEFILKQLGTLP